MTPWRDPDEVDGHRIDPAIADGLLAGRVAPEDAPPELADLAQLLQTARTPAQPSELAGHDAAVAAIVSAAGPEIDLRREAGAGSTLRRIASAPLIVVMLVGVGAAMAAAATGAFGSPRPDVVVLEEVSTTIGPSAAPERPDVTAPTDIPTTSSDGAPVPDAVTTTTTAAPDVPGSTAVPAPSPTTTVVAPPPGPARAPRPTTTVASTVPAVPAGPAGATPGPPAVNRGLCVAFGNRADAPGRSAAAAALAQAAADAGLTVEELCATLPAKGSSNEPRGSR